MKYLFLFIIFIIGGIKIYFHIIERYHKYHHNEEWKYIYVDDVPFILYFFFHFLLGTFLYWIIPISSLFVFWTAQGIYNLVPLVVCIISFLDLWEKIGNFRV